MKDQRNFLRHVIGKTNDKSDKRFKKSEDHQLVRTLDVICAPYVIEAVQKVPLKNLVTRRKKMCLN